MAKLVWVDFNFKYSSSLSLYYASSFLYFCY